MSKTLLLKIKEYQQAIRENNIIRRVVFVLSFIVMVGTLYLLMLPAITVSKLICNVEEHVHTEDCYEKILECMEDVGSESGLGESGLESGEILNTSTSESEDIVVDSDLVEEHVHTEDCYKKILKCEKEEHEHIDTCYEQEEEMDEVQSLIVLIDTIPSFEEFDEQIALMYEEEKSVDEIKVYYDDVIAAANTAYLKYISLSDEDKARVINIDKILEYYDYGYLENSSNSVNTYVVKDGNNYTFNIYHQNTYNWSSDDGYTGHENVFGYTTKETTVGDLIDKRNYGTVFYPYYIVIAKRQSGNIYRVYELITFRGYGTDGKNKDEYEVSANSIVFMVSMEENATDYAAIKDIKLGAKVTVNLNNSLTTEKSSKTSIGTITFVSGIGSQKTKNNNASKLDSFKGVDTKELIEVNLYNYSSNVNDKYNSNKYYPGFQQPAGTTVEHSLSLSDLDNFNFGDTIADEYEKWSITANDANPVGINTLNRESSATIANRPVWNYMAKTLGSDGYPAVLDGANDNAKLSLKYLFSDNTYADKMNKTSVNKLFQKDEDGGYYYDSRDNHAQFDSTTDEFTLYEQKISSNYIQYPFGNFLPFNDIVTETTQASLAGSSRVSEIIDYARYKASVTTNSFLKAKYEQLYLTLINYDNLMAYKSGSYDSSWTAGEGTRSFFDAVSIQSSPTATELNNELKNIYSIDYDEATNFFFGFEMKMNFMQPKNGLTGENGDQPMDFLFTGDDDVWVYIDGVLFLDLSGIHRHVGGRIDFENGLIYYYQLQKSSGDVDLDCPYNGTDSNSDGCAESGFTTFEDVLRAAGKDDDYIKATLKKDADGNYTTFKNYSTHEFNFYYMERGSGSGVMRLEFNMPLVKENSIQIHKEVEDDDDYIGNPDFSFKVMQPNATETLEDDSLFVFAGTEYNLYDDAGNKINEEPLYVDSDGIIKVKAGQHAVINGLAEDTGKYYVIELLDEDWVEQYERVVVDGTTITLDTYDTTLEVGSDTFTGVVSTIKDISDGSTVFTFTNDIDVGETGKLSIEKTISSELDEGVTESLMDDEFEFYVEIDDVPLAVGTKYVVTHSDGSISNKTVKKKGIIVIKACEVATIDKIIGGSNFYVKEEASDTSGFLISYKLNGENVEADYVSGTIDLTSPDGIVSVIANNEEQGVYLPIGVHKTTINPDGLAYTYTFKITDTTGDKNEVIGTKTITVDKDGNGSDDNFLYLKFSQPEHENEETVYTYEITEVKKTILGDLVSENDKYTEYDTNTYEVIITVMNKGKEDFSASYIVKKNGEEVDNDELIFTNCRLGSLTIDKTVDSKNPNNEGAFTFEITSEDISDGEYKTNTDEIVTFTDGKAIIDLVHNETLTIYGLPYGSTYTVKETTTDGYAVTYEVTGGVLTEGVEASNIKLNVNNVDVDSDNPLGISYDTQVSFVNMKGYELPATGSSTIIFVIMGVILIGGPVINIGYSFYKRKERG